MYNVQRNQFSGELCYLYAGGLQNIYGENDWEVWRTCECTGLNG